MATTSEIKKGMCIEFSSDIYMVVEFQHVKPGKGNAFVRTKLKSLTTGRVIDNTFPAGNKVDDVRVERREYQFLYEDGTDYQFMNNETFDQIAINGKMIEGKEFLKEGTVCQIVFLASEERPLACEMPQNVILEVTYIEPGLRGDTASSTLTPCTVETGATVKVPLFMKQGDLIKIDTETGNYIERVKK